MLEPGKKFSPPRVTIPESDENQPQFEMSTRDEQDLALVRNTSTFVTGKLSAAGRLSARMADTYIVWVRAAFV
jgi:hypothetical protein